MCRSNGDGGRRCPSCAPDYRNAGRRAAYAALQAERSAHAAPKPVAGAPGPDVSGAAGPGTLPTVERLRKLVAEVHGLLGQEPFVLLSDDGAFSPTPAGQECEQAVVRLGAELGRVADSRADAAVAQADLEWSAKTGQPTREACQDRVAVRLDETDAKLSKVDYAAHRARQDGTIPAGSTFDGPPEVAALRAELRQQQEVLAAFVDNRDPWAAARQQARADAVRSVLAEIRPMGPEQALVLHPKSARKPAAVLAEAVGYFPTAWIDKSDAHNLPLLVKAPAVWKSKLSKNSPGGRLRGGRAHYRGDVRITFREKVWDTNTTYAYYGETAQQMQTRYDTRTETRNAVATHLLDADGNPRSTDQGDPLVEVVYEARVEQTSWPTVSELTVDSDRTGGRTPGWSTAAHEMSHRMEHVASPRLGELQYAFLHRRARDQDTGRLADQRAIYKGRKEMGWLADSAVHPYVGKTYTTRDGRMSMTHFELLSTGVECVFAGKWGGLRGEDGYRADPEHRALVLGLIAAV